MNSADEAFTVRIFYFRLIIDFSNENCLYFMYLDLAYKVMILFA